MNLLKDRVQEFRNVPNFSKLPKFYNAIKIQMINYIKKL